MHRFLVTLLLCIGLCGSALAAQVVIDRPRGEARFDLVDAKTAGHSSTMSLQLLSPGPTPIATYNHVNGLKDFAVEIPASAAKVKAGDVQFKGLAKGMKNASIVIDGTWYPAVPAADGRFSATIDLSDVQSGPLKVDVLAWDTEPGNHNFKTALKLRVTLMVTGGAKADDAAKTNAYLQLLSPGPTSVSTHNQAQSPEAFAVAISDEAATVAAAKVPFTGIAKGMKNVSIIVNGYWNQTVPAADGTFSSVIDLTNAAYGPLVVDIFAWDSPPGDHTFKTALKLRALLFVTGGEDARPPKQAPVGHPAHGMNLVFDEDFSKPMADRWYFGSKPNGQQYGMAMFMPLDDPAFNPYTIRDGFLRIRAKYDPGMDDPWGWGRKWRAGQLSSAFPDGRASVAVRKGYFEMRALLPKGSGIWPGFWLMDVDNILDEAQQGGVEVDIIEAYGADPSKYSMTIHNWPHKSKSGVGYQRAYKHATGFGDYSAAFHTYGCKITDAEVIFFFDGVEKWRTPLYRAATVAPFYMLIDLATSADRVIDVPPSGYQDMWVSNVRVYE